MTTIYLVDDHELFLSGVRAELSERFEVAGWSTDVDAAVDGIRKHRPERRARRCAHAGWRRVVGGRQHP